MHFPDGINLGGNSGDSSSGDGEEYGVYLKILDVDCNIDSGISNTLTSDSTEVAEFFSDAFSLGDKDYSSGCPSYSHETMYEQLAKVAIEAKRKEMGMPNIYDTLQKKVPLLALRTKTSYYNGEVDCTEKLLILRRVEDERGKEIATGIYKDTIYCNVESIVPELGYDDIYVGGTIVEFSPKGIKITNIE